VSGQTIVTCPYCRVAPQLKVVYYLPYMHALRLDTRKLRGDFTNAYLGCPLFREVKMVWPVIVSPHLYHDQYEFTRHIAGIPYRCE
jgi:hypothetical protein